MKVEKTKINKTTVADMAIGEIAEIRKGSYEGNHLLRISGGTVLLEDGDVQNIPDTTRVDILPVGTELKLTT